MMGEQDRGRELESKFEVSAEFELPSFDRTIDTSSIKLSATYWDTRDHRLLGWGHTLRYRTASDGSEDGWTLKLAGPPGASSTNVLDRREIDALGSAESPPGELLEIIIGVVRRKRLVPVATIETERQRIVLADPDEGHAGDPEGALELSDDRVSSMVGDNPGPAFRQIEVEAKDPGSARLLKKISRRLIEAGATPTASTKFERVLGGRPGPEISVPSPREDSSVDELVRFAIGNGVVRLIEHDPSVRMGSDPESVHQARVATRRLRSDLKTLEPLLTRTRVEHIRDELAWTGQLLGGVRDLDVLIGRIDDLVSRSPAPDRDASPSIIEALRDARGRRHQELRDALGSQRYIRLVDGLVSASRVAPLEGTRGARRARPVLRKLIRKAWRRTARAVGELEAHPSDAELHEIRKRAKRARYAAELGSGIFGRQPRRLAKHLATLQDVLGELQDTVVAEEHLRSLANRRLPGEAAFAAGTLVCQARDARSDARERWRAEWTSAKRTRLRRWLG